MQTLKVISIASLLFAVTGCASFGGLTNSEQNFQLFSDAYEQFHQAHYRNSVVLFEKYLSSDSSYHYQEAFAFLAESYRQLGEIDSGKAVYKDAINLFANPLWYDRNFDLNELIQWAWEFPAFPLVLSASSRFELSQALPTVISKTEPVYPSTALNDNLSGYTLVAVAVDTDGIVIKSKLLKSTSEVFNEPSREAAMQWRFTPYMRFGRHLGTWISVPFYFSIDTRPRRSYLKSEPNDWKLPPLLILGDTAVHPTQPRGDTASHGIFTAYDSNASVLEKTEPTYPQSELARGDEADVYVRVWISPEGLPLQVVVFKSSDANFNQAAAEAAMKWRFKAPTLKGKPVSTWITIPFRFRLLY
jgi:TonB family protein